jgi:hypothetical protein
MREAEGERKSVKRGAPAESRRVVLVELDVNSPRRAVGLQSRTMEATMAQIECEANSRSSETKT